MHRIVQGRRFAAGVILKDRCRFVTGELRVAEFFRKFSFLRKDTVMKNESWDVRMDGDMVFAGLSERTREAYLRAARQLAKFRLGSWRSFMEGPIRARSTNSTSKMICCGCGRKSEPHRERGRRCTNQLPPAATMICLL